MACFAEALSPSPLPKGEGNKVLQVVLEFVVEVSLSHRFFIKQRYSALNDGFASRVESQGDL